MGESYASQQHAQYEHVVDLHFKLYHTEDIYILYLFVFDSKLNIEK